jgi:hypothetical protein
VERAAAARSARIVAAGMLAAPALAPLPLPIVLHIFSLLPVDCRLHCAEVCRGWRAVLLERSLWTRLDLSRTSGVRVPARDMDGLLRCAAARASGGLQSLQVDDSYVYRETLFAVATANAGALRELRTDGYCEGVTGFEPSEAKSLLGAAPQLRVFATDLKCNADVQAVRRALRNKAHFAPLRVRCLSTNLGDEDAAGVIAFAADVAVHASLTGLTLTFARLDSQAAVDAVVDAALTRRLQTLNFCNCRISASTSVPALARLLGGDALTTLTLDVAKFSDAPGAPVLAAALRANSTLTSLTLDDARLFRDAAVAAELLGALTAHPSVRALNVRFNRVRDAGGPTVGAALGALLAANTPALTELDVSYCELRDDGLRPLFEALPTNTHLRELRCSENRMSEAFAAGVLLPAVRANTGLRTLHTGAETASERESEELVARRSS